LPLKETKNANQYHQGAIMTRWRCVDQEVAITTCHDKCRPSTRTSKPQHYLLCNLICSYAHMLICVQRAFVIVRTNFVFFFLLFQAHATFAFNTDALFVFCCVCKYVIVLYHAVIYESLSSTLYVIR
jgi:hypothetical protein